MFKAEHFTRLLLMALMLIGATTDVLAQEYITEVMTIGAEKGKGTQQLLIPPLHYLPTIYKY